MKIRLAVAALMALAVLACRPETAPSASSQKPGSAPNAPLVSPIPEQTDTLHRGGDIYPRTGKTAADFLPRAGTYEVEYEAAGDLNADGLADLALVLGNKKDRQGVRPVLVLLARPDKTYRLDKVSHFVFPVEYSDVDFKNYDTEDISISDSALHIQLYGIGPQGNLFSTFKYYGKELLLTAIETYNMGAGSHQQMDYDVLKGMVEIEIINTMEEEMPSETKSYPVKKQTFPFENADPENIIRDVYRQTEA